MHWALLLLTCKFLTYLMSISKREENQFYRPKMFSVSCIISCQNELKMCLLDEKIITKTNNVKMLLKLKFEYSNISNFKCAT